MPDVRRQKDLRIHSAGEIRERFADFNEERGFLPRRRLRQTKSTKATSEPAEGKREIRALSQAWSWWSRLAQRNGGSRLAAGLTEKGGS